MLVDLYSLAAKLLDSNKVKLLRNNKAIFSLALWLFLCCLSRLFATDFYPLYKGYPPTYKGPGFYQDDLAIARADKVNEFSFPLYFEPAWVSGNRKVGVLILHGYTSGPLQNVELQTFLYNHHIASYAMRFPGHGTTTEDLKKQNLEDWLEAIKKPLAFLKLRCDEVYVYGVCAGGSMALITAEQHPEIKGILLQAPFVKCGDSRFYTLTPIIPVADFFGIELGQAYVDIGMNTRHYCYPYNTLRSNFQILKSTAMVRRQISNIKVPILSIHSPLDPVADPESELYLGYASNAPFIKILWYGTEHTPLIHPNADIYQEILTFLQAPSESLTHSFYRSDQTEIIRSAPKPDTGDFFASYISGQNNRGSLEWPQYPFSSGFGVKAFQEKNHWGLGVGVVVDHLNSKLNPSFGYKWDTQLLITQDFGKNAWVMSSGEWYHEWVWEHVSYIQGTVIPDEPIGLKMGYRFPIWNRTYDDGFAQGDVGLDESGIQLKVRYYIQQRYEVHVGIELEPKSLVWGISL